MLESPGYAFGPFQLMPGRRLLLRHGDVVTLTPKAFDTLVALVERRDRVVTREELLDHLWSGVAVEEANLTQQVFLLRKALDESGTGEQHIATVPRRGYRFVADVTVLQLPQELPRMVAEPREHRRSSRVRRRRSVVGAIVTVAVVATAVWLWRSSLSDSRTGGLRDDPSRVAVLPFSYRGSDEHAALGENMADLLSTTLDGAGRLRTVDPRGVFGVLLEHRRIRERPSTLSGADLDEARAVAQRLGAGRYVVGEIVEAGGRVRISARLYRMTADSDPVVAAVEGLPTELFALNDSLGAQLAVGETTGSVQLASTAMRTSANLDALKAFLRGEQLFRAQQTNATRRTQAYKEYGNAVDLDPAFALSWYRRSQLAYFSGQGLNRVSDFAESAYRHRDNLPWRHRRLVEANWAYAKGAAREAQAAYLEILKTYPDDAEAVFGIALLGSEYGWLLGGPLNSHRRELEAFLRYQPDDYMGLWLLRNLEAQERHCAAVDPLTRKIFPDAPAHTAIGVLCGPLSPRHDEFLRGASEWPAGQLRLARLWVSGLSQNPRGALALARQIDSRGESLPIDLLFTVELELALGRRASAQEKFARLASVYEPWSLEDGIYRMLASYLSVKADDLRAWRESLERWNAAAVPDYVAPAVGRAARHDGLHGHLRTYLIGRIDARLAEYDAALRHADELERMPAPPESGSVSRDLAQSVRAHVLEAQGRLDEALRAIEAAPREVPFRRRNEWIFTAPQDRYLRAEILNRLGRPADALWWYQSLHYMPESVLAGPSHLRQAEMHERLGQRQQAAEQYRRFLELWSDCDREFRPLLERAERAVRQLGGD